jgi:hypothetical protein
VPLVDWTTKLAPLRAALRVASLPLVARRVELAIKDTRTSRPLRRRYTRAAARWAQEPGGGAPARRRAGDGPAAPHRTFLNGCMLGLRLDLGVMTNVVCHKCGCIKPRPNGVRRSLGGSMACVRSLPRVLINPKRSLNGFSKT